MMEHQKQRKQRAKSNGRSWPPGLFCILLGLAVTGLCFVFFAFLLSRADLPLYMAVPFSTASVCAGALLISALLTRTYKCSGALVGLCVGAVMLGLFVAAALLEGEPQFTSLTALRAAALLLSGLLGGLFANYRNSAPKRPKRP